MGKPLLVTGATGKVGRAFTRALFADPRFSDFRVRALCHKRTLDPTDRLEVLSGSIEHREVVAEAFREVTHVLHLARPRRPTKDLVPGLMRRERAT